MFAIAHVCVYRLRSTEPLRHGQFVHLCVCVDWCPCLNGSVLPSRRKRPTALPPADIDVNCDFHERADDSLTDVSVTCS